VSLVFGAEQRRTLLELRGPPLPFSNHYRSDYLARPEDDYALIMPETDEPEDIGRFVRKWTHLVEHKEFVVLNTGAHWGGMTVSRSSRARSHASP